MKQLSVIIPNYNYAQFLARRIKSIISQTVKPGEIIFLDDCSTDDSLIIAENLLNQTDIPYTIICNETNQGVFRQWLKGIELAKYNYIWIAEADDYCESNFLETLLPAFDDEKVVLAYCQSHFVDQDGEIIAQETDYKLEFFTTKRWENNYLNKGIDEVENYLSVLNTIPNASAVVFNKSRIDIAKLNILNDYTKAGDWLFYILALTSYADNLIFYASQKSNYYVRHTRSVYGSNHKNNIMFKEVLSIYNYTLNTFLIKDELKLQMMTQVLDWFIWFDYSEECIILLNNVVQAASYSHFFLLLKQLIEKLYISIGEKNKISNQQNQEFIKQDQANFNQNQKILEQIGSPKNLEQINKELRAQIARLESSISWRVTRPLRVIKKSLCRILK